MGGASIMGRGLEYSDTDIFSIRIEIISRQSINENVTYYSFVEKFKQNNYCLRISHMQILLQIILSLSHVMN